MEQTGGFVSVSPLNAGGRLTIDLDAIVANWRLLDQLSRPGRAAAVVKANAYGLGAEKVSAALWDAGCDTFFVALPDEGFALRKHLPQATIYVLNGLTAENIGGIFEGGLVPVLASLEQIDLWAHWNSKRGAHASCAIMVDTGMNRLGLTVDEAIALRARNMKEHAIAPVMVMSHLACADEQDHPLTQRQIESFQVVADAFSDIDSSLSNSAGILRHGALGHTLTRPGISLYGGEAIDGGDARIQPIVRLEGRIMQIRDVKKGDSVSYGATHICERDSRIAIVSVGYADGYPRAASGAGVPLRGAITGGAYGAVGGHRVPLVGRVTMDLTMFDVTGAPDDALASGWLELIGPNVPLDELAAASGTISYEILTGLGQRFARAYRGGEA